MSEQADNVPMNDAAGDAAPVHQGELHQFISFRVGDEEFAIDIMAVREIKGWTQTAPLPNQPDYNLGVLNLRGTIVPTFDLRCRFGLGRTETTPFHVVIIVTVKERTMGLLVDAVSDILTVNEDQIRPVPDMDRIAAAEFLSGIIPVEENMVVLLSLEKLFQRGDFGSSADVAA
ncbi:chemotaxis protein CheW [Labrenzia sp. PHM005]|uniref:chemotaxis protein CheW n=1 Tax=Labrenzia sp. PHM005 TaxID=2590016 RepID=UPI001FFD4042|nr:chemotaxis protein CheW [Labrenzia sp. PHM005]